MKEKLKQEFNDFIETLPSRVGETPKNVIFNWWMEKIEEREAELSGQWCIKAQEIEKEAYQKGLKKIEWNTKTFYPPNPN